MAGSNFSKARRIPSVTTKKSNPTTTNFAKGIYTYKPNDTMDFDEIYLAQNARFDRIGEYKTRRGLAPLCEPIGKTKAQDTYTTTYDMVNETNVSLAISSADPIYSINLTVAASNATDYGVLQISLLDANNDVVATSCAQNLTTTPTDTEFVFKDAPKGNFTLKLAPQGTSKQTFTVACPSGTTPMYKLNTATAGHVTNLFEANIDGAKTILFTFKTSTGTTTLYRMAANGTITLIRTLPSGVEKVRFSQNVNKIRYADGKEAPHIIDPSTWADSAIPTTDLKSGETLTLNVSNILAGTQDNMMYFDADTTTQAVWTYPYGFEYAPEADYETSAALNEYVPGSTTTTTIDTSTLTPVSSTHLVPAIETGDIIIDDNNNYGEATAISGSSITVTSISHIATAIESYDAFDRDFRQNFPAIKTGDPLTAMFNLGGTVYFLTRRNKYYMYSQTADVWTQRASSAQHGTFSQESCVCDLNYAYYANDDGIYIFDGSSEGSLTQNTIQGTYDAIAGKESITLELYNNRLYVFYSSTGNGLNDSCLVYNINLKLWESFDTGLPVSATIARQTASNRFICGSSQFGQLYSFETTTNDYADLGAPIDFDLETAYLHFGTPSQLHRITKWRPEFAKVDGNYTIKCGYALDFTDDVKYAFSINLHNNTPINEHYVWDNPPDYGNAVAPTKLTHIPQVNGQFYRCQLRYQHHAAFEPTNFKAHTLSCETQRLR
ncbi:hypothetical protein J6S35_00665 [Candidatus Saccharibacteria bacterium]|nr:hypothetical protein [Candidatus Saccharibacteria bacterium]